MAAYPLLYAQQVIIPAALLGGVGLAAVVLAAVLRVGIATASGLFALAGEYVLTEVAGRVPMTSIVGYSAGLFVLAELLLWLRQLPAAARIDVAVLSRWSLGVALAAVMAAVLAFVILAVTGLQMGGSVSGALTGSGALIVLLALTLVLVRRGRAGSGGGRR